MGKEKEISLIIKGETTDAEKKINKFKQNMEEATNVAIKFKESLNFKSIATQFISLVKRIDTLTKYTDDYISSQNVLRQTFGETTKGVNDYIEKLSYMTGTSMVDLSRKSALFGQMATSLGMANDQAKDFVISLDDMASKLALLYGKDFNSMAKAMLDAVKGESSTLATLTGNVLKTGALQATLDSLGIDLVASELSGVNKALLEYITIAKQTTVTDDELKKIVNDLAWQKQILKSQVKELANAIGNLLYPVLRAILPVFNAILITITAIIKTLASVFGITNDLTKNVTSNANAYDNLGASIQGASNKAKRGLRSFDKLNNITTPTPSSSSGGGGGIEINPQLLNEFNKLKDKMLDINNKAQEISDKILNWLGFTKQVNGQLKWSGTTLLKNIYKWWYKLSLLGKIIAGIGLAVSTAKVYSILKKIITLVKKTKFADILGTIAGNIKEFGLKGFVKNLTMAYPVLSKIIGVALGFIDIFQGIKNLHSGLNSIVNDGKNLYNVLQSIIGAIEILSGMALIIGVLTGNIPLIIGGFVGTLTSIAGELAISKQKVDELSESFDFGNEKIKEYNKNIATLKEKVKEATVEIYAKTGRAEQLAQEISNLYDANGNLIGSEEELGEKVNALNLLLGTNYVVTKDGTVAVDDREISVQELIKTVEKYCKQLRIQAELEAYYDLYVERAKKKIELEKEIKAKTEELTKAQENYDLTTEEGVKKFLSDNADKIVDLNKLEKELKDNSFEMEKYEKASYQASIGQYDTASALLRDTSKATQRTMADTTTELINNINKIPKAVRENMTKINNITATVKIVADASEFWKAYNKTKDLTIGGVSFSPVKAYASGGFVDKGDLFIANESGAELVGSMNGKTTVANNEQIVEGIEGGVTRGVRKALNSVNLKGNNPIYVKAQFGDDEITGWVQAKANERERQYGF